MYLAIPAFWTPDQKSPTTGVDLFTTLVNALKATYSNPDGTPTADAKENVVVLEASWPDAVNSRPAQQAVIEKLRSCTRLFGYVNTRDINTFQWLGTDAILANAAKWLDVSQYIEGIYFDVAVLPQAADNDPQNLVSQFRKAHSNLQIWLLAGQGNDPWIVAPVTGPDAVVLWEEPAPTPRHPGLAYLDEYYPLAKGGATQPLPLWWKDPRNRGRFSHTLSGVGNADWQRVTDLARERNTSHLVVLGAPAGGPYNDLPSWFPNAVDAAASYNNPATGLADHELLWAAYCWGLQHGHLFAWPNFEQAWYQGNDPAGHVRGTWHIDPGAAGVTLRNVDAAQLGTPPLYDVPGVCAAVQTWATKQQGVHAAIPIFDLGSYTAPVFTPPTYKVVTFDATAAWLSTTDVPISEVYEKPPPTFAEPGSVGRNVGRWASQPPRNEKTAFATFIADTLDPTGRQGTYRCIMFQQAAPIQWEDVRAADYLAALRAAPI